MVTLRLSSLATAALAALTMGWGFCGPAAAEDQTVVVELFTSQGCSSCPPADAALAKIADRKDVVALSLHVDYWDYLGWRDTFAQHQFGLRQADYRDPLNQRAVYTPQLIVHGTTAVRPSGLESAVREAHGKPRTARLTLSPHDGMLMCRFEPTGEAVAGTIWIAKYTRSETVQITRGENAGRTTTYRNVVTSLSRYGEWDGDEVEEYAVPQPDPGEGVAVWLQQGDNGPILAAVRLDNPEGE